MTRLCLLVALLLSCIPAVASADSDHYYCAGPGYLAYESRLQYDAPGHELHVVRFSRAGGITVLPPIPLDDFQVHDMTCGATTVELRSSRMVYVVDLAAAGGPRVGSRAIRADERPSGSTPNLGHYAKPGVVDLASDGAPGEFQLVITRAGRSIEGGLERFTISEVVRRDVETGFTRILASQRVFQGVFFETVH